jgi:glutamine cyclotransferase
MHEIGVRYHLVEGRIGAVKGMTSLRNLCLTTFIAFFGFSAASAGQDGAAHRAAVYGYEVVNAYPHDPGAFTQGLIYQDGFLYESTGQHGRSTIRKVKLDTGEVVQQRSLETRYFAEGLTGWGQRLIQLTWQSNVGFIYQLSDLSPLGSFRFMGEGWGLTHDSRKLILSDGTSALRFLKPDNYEEIGRLGVKDGQTPIQNLNELEYIRGEIYANVWHSDDCS